MQRKPKLPRTAPARRNEPGPTPWTFLTNHAHVLLCIVRDPGVRLRDVADHVGVTERAVQRIVTELEEAGYLQREKDGRCNRYEVDLRIPLRHPIEQHCPASDLIQMVLGRARSPRRAG